jgi:hypothetical protein
MGLGNIHGSGVGGKATEGNPIPFENLLKIKAIDGAQGVQLVEGGYEIAILDLRYPINEDRKIVVMVFISYLKAGLLNVPDP